MSAERYKYLVDFVQDHYILGCPAVIEKGALLQDTLNDTVILRLRVRNVSRKTIKYLSILVNMYDDANDPLFDEKPQDFAYLDLSVNQRESFGDNQANILIDANTRKVKIIIEKIVFTDETVWRNEDEEVGVRFPEQQLLTELEADLLAQFNREFENSGLSEVSGDLIKYIPKNEEVYWQCSCGFSNNIGEETCLFCGMNKDWIFKNTNTDLLNQKMKQYVKKQEELEAERLVEKNRLEMEMAIEIESQLEKNEAKKKKLKIILPVVGVLAVLFILMNTLIMPEIKRWNDYNQAIEFMEKENFGASTALFTSLGKYKDSENYLREIDYIKATDLMVKEKYLKAKEIFITLRDYKDTKKYLEEINLKLPKEQVAQNYKNNIIVTESHAVGLKSNGEVVAVGENDNKQCKVAEWADIVQISANDNQTVGLKWDGTVVTTSYDETVKSQLSKWTDINSIICSGSNVFGLKTNGMVITTGSNNSEGQCNVSEWRDIKSVFPNFSETFGLKTDGTVLVTGKNDYGECNVTDWKDIVAISPAGIMTIGLKTDGTVVATGSNKLGQCNVSDWTNISEISCSGTVTLGLRSDGTVVATGDNRSGACNVSDWSNIISVIAINDGKSYGLRSDGTVIAIGYQSNYCDTTGWKDIIAIFPAHDHLLGLKSDGTVVTTNHSYFGFNEGNGKVEDWRGIAVPII